MIEKNLGHVLCISSWYPNRTSKTHGIFVKRHAKALSIFRPVCVLHSKPVSFTDPKTQFEIEFKNEGNFSELILYYKKSKNNIPIVGNFFKWKDNQKAINKALLILEEKGYRFTLLWLNVFFPSGIIALEIKKRLKIPLITLEHWTGYQKQDGNYRGWIKKLITKKCNEKSNCVITVTSDLKSNMIDHGIINHYEIINNVVENYFFEEPISAREKFEFIHISSLDDRQKNIRLLIQGISEARKKYPDIKLHIIGPREKESELQQFQKEFLIPDTHLIFHGEKLEKDLIQIMKKCSAVLLSSRYENMPVVISESLALGIPVITSNVGGIAEHVNEERGILFDSESVEKMVEAIFIFFEKRNFDPYSIRRYAVEQFSEEQIGKKLADICKNYG